MSLQEVVKKIKEVKGLAEADVLEQPRETLGGRLARQRNAVTSLRSLTEEYSRELVSSSAFILVSGPQSQSFSDQAVAKYGCFSASADLFFEDLAQRVAPVLWLNKESSPNLLDVVGRHLEDKALELGIAGYPQIIFKASYRRQLTNKADFVGFLKQALTEQMGAEIVGIQACRSIIPAAIARSHSASITPVIITIDGADVETVGLALKRLSRHVAKIVTGDEITEGDVDQIMKSVRSQITGVPLKVESETVQAVIEDVTPLEEVNLSEVVEQVQQQVSNKNRNKNKGRN